jgi:hypothetical protein
LPSGVIFAAILSQGKPVPLTSAISGNRRIRAILSIGFATNLAGLRRNSENLSHWQSGCWLPQINRNFESSSTYFGARLALWGVFIFETGKNVRLSVHLNQLLMGAMTVARIS